MSDGKMVEDAVTAASTGGGFGAAFFFLRWVWQQFTGRMDRKQALIDAQEEKVDREWEKVRIALSVRLDKIEKQNEALRYAFHHVAGALIRVDPKNPALVRAEQVLAQAFPLDFTIIAARAEAAVDLAEDDAA